jgi:hypothetical protein
MSIVSSVNNVSAITEASQDSEPMILADLNLRNKSGIVASSNVHIVELENVVWNDVCKTSYKWDVYPLDIRENAETGATSSLTMDIDLSQMSPGSKIELKFFGCTREYVGYGWLSFDVNGYTAVEKAPVYDGPDVALPPHLVEKNDGKQIDHLDETTIDITDFVQQGINRIQMRLHPETQSGVSIRWIEVVQSK